MNRCLKFLILYFCMLMPLYVFALQPGPEQPIYHCIRQSAVFNGDVYQYIAEHIEYPRKARKSKIEGRVLVDFQVDESGKVSDAHVVKSLESVCDKEAIRVVESMPAWQPGQENGRVVKSRYALSVLFTLNPENKIVPFVNEAPSFKENLNDYLMKNIHYPNAARKAAIEGSVMVTFVVGKDGEVYDVNVYRGIGGGCDEEVVKVVQNMHGWNPRKQNGIVASIQYSLPIVFSSKSPNGIDTSHIAPQIFMYVEQMPSFAGDINAYLAKNIHYPESAKKAGITGRVIAKFVINSDGMVSDVEIVKGVDKDCDEEAYRVISAMPAWKPGKQNGKAVNVYFTLPIVFKF
jgi:TonB family protein